ncbi:hypothetical Protein psc1_07130 [Candidatus Phytoplasma solani]
MVVKLIIFKSNFIFLVHRFLFFNYFKNINPKRSIYAIY